MATRIYTRTGDGGETGLFGDQRVPKDDARIEACGAVDELNCMLGLALTRGDAGDLMDLLLSLQRDLFTLGADLATPLATGDKHGAVAVERVSDGVVTRLEREIDTLEAALVPLTRFILPGGCPLAANLHLARAVCRRAERRCVALSHRSSVNPAALRYLNRLSDLLFVMARAANQRAGLEDVPWR